ncbi:MAG: phytanoyl-CoA dioxygenase family protein, partial [Lentisphaeria bacterium]|nr:phytanoyl-CoA dioxygenase family protein [Lentisphaeria bacterium]
MLSNEQYQHFQTFGFIILRQFFTSDEVKNLHEEFEKGLNLAYKDRPFDGSERHWASQLGPDTPFYASLPEDERFWSIAAQLYGEDAFIANTDANRYIGDTPWHFDHFIDPAEDCYGVKFAFYLDPVGPDSGSLRLVPGSHKLPLHDDLRENMPLMGLSVEDVPSYISTCEPGDVLAFDMRCWHASS